MSLCCYGKRQKILQMQLWKWCSSLHLEMGSYCPPVNRKGVDAKIVFWGHDSGDVLNATWESENKEVKTHNTRLFQIYQRSQIQNVSIDVHCCWMAKTLHMSSYGLLGCAPPEVPRSPLWALDIACEENCGWRRLHVSVLSAVSLIRMTIALVIGSLSF